MYVNGNPVIYKDPTGHCFELFLYFTDAGYELQQTFSPIAVKISIEIGSEQIGIGIDVSIGVPTLFPVAYRESWGETSYINNYGEFQGTEQRHGEEWTVGYFVSYGYTTFSSGDTSQTTYTLTVGTPWINIKYENDMNLHEAAGINLPSFSDAAGDSYRTGAFQANFFGFSGGINIFTGSKSNLYPNGTYLDDGQNDPDKYRAGVLYIGFGPIRLGVNSEVVRGGVQNGIHDLTGDPHFAVLDIKPTFYFYFGTGSGGTLW
jgi:hypothetical protein